MLFDGLSNVYALKVLCEQGWDINERLIINNQTLLHNILIEIINQQDFCETNIEMVNFALKNGANIEMADEQGNTPLSLLTAIEKMYGESPENQFMLQFAKSHRVAKHLQRSTPRLQKSSSSFRL
jgi:ankyrin repeat protein